MEMPVQPYALTNALKPMLHRRLGQASTQLIGKDEIELVVPKTLYKNNTLRLYALNYYDKHGRLCALTEEGKPVSAEDLRAAKDVLRLEVQCGYQFIKRLCKKLHINPTFGEMLSYDVAYTAEEMVFDYVFCGNEAQDFYTYSAAAKLLPPRSSAARTVLLRSSQNHKITQADYSYGRSVIAKAGIYPFCFLPKNSKIPMLNNPLKLIAAKLSNFNAAQAV